MSHVPGATAQKSHSARQLGLFPSWLSADTLCVSAVGEGEVTEAAFLWLPGLSPLSVAVWVLPAVPITTPAAPGS